MLNSREKKSNNNNGKFFKVECNKCSKYGQGASYFWGNSNKNDNINNNKTARNLRFNGECNNRGKRGHRDADCCANKGKERYDDTDNLFVGAKLCGEVQEENNEEDIKEWLGDSGASSHITYKKKDMTDVEKYEINVTVGNDQKMKCDLKVSVNMKLKDGQKMKLTEVLYVPQAVKNLLRVSRLLSKGATIGATQDNHKENGVSVILDARKG